MFINYKPINEHGQSLTFKESVKPYLITMLYNIYKTK